MCGDVRLYACVLSFSCVVLCSAPVCWLFAVHSCVGSVKSIGKYSVYHSSVCCISIGRRLICCMCAVCLCVVRMCVVRVLSFRVLYVCRACVGLCVVCLLSILCVVCVLSVKCVVCLPSVRAFALRHPSLCYLCVRMWLGVPLFFPSHVCSTSVCLSVYR